MVNVENIKIGEKYKLKDLVELTGAKCTNLRNHNSRTKVIKDLECYLKLTKEGYFYFVEDIYEKPKERVLRTVNNGYKNTYVNYTNKLIYYYLYKKYMEHFLLREVHLNSKFINFFDIVTKNYQYKNNKRWNNFLDIITFKSNEIDIIFRPVLTSIDSKISETLRYIANYGIDKFIKHNKGALSSDYVYASKEDHSWIKLSDDEVSTYELHRINFMDETKVSEVVLKFDKETIINMSKYVEDKFGKKVCMGHEFKIINYEEMNKLFPKIKEDIYVKFENDIIKLRKELKLLFFNRLMEWIKERYSDIVPLYLEQFTIYLEEVFGKKFIEKNKKLIKFD